MLWVCRALAGSRGAGSDAVLPLADADDAQGVRVARGAGGRPALRAARGGERQSGRLVHGLES